MTAQDWPAYAWSFAAGDGTANVGFGMLLPSLRAAPRGGRAELHGRLAELLPGVQAERLVSHHLPLSTSRPPLRAGPGAARRRRAVAHQPAHRRGDLLRPAVRAARRRGGGRRHRRRAPRTHGPCTTSSAGTCGTPRCWRGSPDGRRWSTPASRQRPGRHGRWTPWSSSASGRGLITAPLVGRAGPPAAGTTAAGQPRRAACSSSPSAVPSLPTISAMKRSARPPTNGTEHLRLADHDVLRARPGRLDAASSRRGAPGRPGSRPATSPTACRCRPRAPTRRSARPGRPSAGAWRGSRARPAAARGTPPAAARRRAAPRAARPRSRRGSGPPCAPPTPSRGQQRRRPRRPGDARADARADRRASRARLELGRLERRHAHAGDAPAVELADLEPVAVDLDRLAGRGTCPSVAMT